MSWYVVVMVRLVCILLFVASAARADDSGGDVWLSTTNMGASRGVATEWLPGGNAHETLLHEIGHALGLEHEHQNPFAGITGDSDAVRSYFQGPPNNWDAQAIDWNILRKISPGEVKGTNWDPNSVMEYAFGAGLIVEPAAYRAGLHPKGGLSAAASVACAGSSGGVVAKP